MTQLDVLSDFNADPVGRYLRADTATPSLSVRTAPFGQLFQSLQVPGDGEASFLWVRPEGISPAYAAQLDGEPVPIEAVLQDVEAFARMLVRYAEARTAVLVSSFVATRNDHGLGMLNWSANGPARVRAAMNLLLAERLQSAPGVYMLDAQRWIDAGQPGARSAKHWYAMKTPFAEETCLAAARDVKAALRGALGQTRKIVVVDLDDTLWGGVVGETGWQGLRLGGHDHVGEAFVDFQRALKALTKRGIQVALVSKNDEGVALEAIDRHPAMVLRRDDLAGWRINWQDKARNIVDLVAELKLGLQSVVFIDDNPVERGRVREALPDVLVPEWPKAPAQYADTLRVLDCFEQAAITDEDRQRTNMYVVARDRQESAANFDSLEEWLVSLRIRVDGAPLSNANVKRAVQLLNKTNQLNLRTRRLTETELWNWRGAEPGRQVMALSVTDRFGDLGLTGVLSWQCSEEELEIVDYLLSCRAMGRQVENFMVHMAVQAARAAGLARVCAPAVPTERNGPCLEFWRYQSGFVEVEENVFVWDTANDYPTPTAVNSGHE